MLTGEQPFGRWVLGGGWRSVEFHSVPKSLRCVPFLSTSRRKILVRGSAATRLGKETNMKTFINMLKDESGASAAEYALILAIVGSALAVAAYGLGNTIANAMNNAGSRINACQDGSC